MSTITSPERVPVRAAAKHPSPSPATTPARGPSTTRQFLRYAVGIVRHPIATLDELATERSIRWAVIVASLGIAQVWGNMLLFAAFGFNWLGSEPLLEDPTYVGWFGYLRVPAGQWLPIFAAYLPASALYSLVVTPGAAHVLSKPWGGRATFEQMVNVLVFATVPGLAIGWASEWLTGVPLNLLSGQAYFYGAAMQGTYGPTMAALWTTYAIAVYAVPWAWGLVLGTIAIRRVERIPWVAAALAMVLAFSLSLLVTSTFVR